MLKVWNSYIAKSSYVNSRRKSVHIFFIAYFLGDISKFDAETSHGVSDSQWFTEIRWICFKFCFDKKLPNSTGKRTLTSSKRREKDWRRNWTHTVYTKKHAILGLNLNSKEQKRSLVMYSLVTRYIPFETPSIHQPAFQRWVIC